MSDPTITADTLRELIDMSEEELTARALRDPLWFQTVALGAQQVMEEDRRASQLSFYSPANPDAIKVHRSTAREVAIVGGNRSSKSDTMLAELSIQMTGHVPLAIDGQYPREKIRAPIRARVVCNSLTDTLIPVILPKLRWDQWNGVGDPADGRGHWGWIPRNCLVGGSWEKAYTQHTRTLHTAVDTFWRGADGHMNRMAGVSTCQFLSYDQDLSAFTGSSMHFVGHDELPPSDIYRENRMRTLDVKGQIITAFTPPDEIGASIGDVTWFYDEIYEPGLPGPHRHPSLETITLFTEKNRILSSADIAELASRMTDEQRAVRLYGRFIHMTGVIYPLFERHEATWCFQCQKRILAVEGHCPTCHGTNLTVFSHVVEPFDVPSSWPVVCVIDPHPRKADRVGWFAVSPADDCFMIAELQPDGTIKDKAREIKRIEDALRVYPAKRLMDPNMATQTDDRLQRGFTPRRAYADEGIRCDLANDEMQAGIDAVREGLKPDPRLRYPRLRFFSTCDETIHSMSRWRWSEWSRQQDREPKEAVHDRHKDGPDLVRYFMMDRPSFRGYVHGPTVQRNSGRRKGY